MSYTLYAIPHHFLTQKILIAAQYSGAVVKLSENFIFGVTNKSNEFLKKFPYGKVPALETSDNNYLSESSAIAYYVGNDQIRGATVEEEAQILQWLRFGDNKILPPARTWILPLLGVIQYNKQSTEKAKKKLKRVLKVLNRHLKTRTCLVGEHITLADISLCCNLLSLYQMVLEPSFRSAFRNVNRWFTMLINQPQFKTVLGNVTLCEKMTQSDGEIYADVLSKLKDELAKPKKEKKGEKKGKKEQEPKSKDPFEAFPKGTFNMDTFKTVYKFNDKTKSIEYFWEKFDPENYSIWYCEYLFSKDLPCLTRLCWNNNDVMFQLLGEMRKNAFASVCLFGEDDNISISGIWVWRGHELAFILSEDWQINYKAYSWKKLNPSTKETKTLVSEYLAWAGDFGGKKFNQGIIFS